jgi:hypothetical protein
MKALIFLVIVAAAVSVVVWRTRKAQAEEARARRQAIERRKKQQQENLAQDMDMVWPVVIRPVKGDEAAAAEEQAEEPSMTTIEYEPPEKAAS